MASRTLTCSLTEKSITSLIKKLESYKRAVDNASDKIADHMANIGAKIAEQGFEEARAYYVGEGSYSIRVNNSGKGKRQIEANGDIVSFLEFGAGVHYNGIPGDYPKPRPAGVVGIGEYGHHRGRNDYWYIRHGVRSYGNPAGKGMAYAVDWIRQDAPDIAEEVLKNAGR